MSVLLHQELLKCEVDTSIRDRTSDRLTKKNNFIRLVPNNNLPEKLLGCINLERSTPQWTGKHSKALESCMENVRLSIKILQIKYNKEDIIQKSLNAVSKETERKYKNEKVLRVNGNGVLASTVETEDNIKAACLKVMNEFDKVPQETNELERLIKLQRRPDNRREIHHKISNWLNWLAKNGNYMDFHKKRRMYPEWFTTTHIKNNKNLSEMFKPFYNFRKDKGNLKTFFYHNRQQFPGIPDHFRNMKIYDPDIRVNEMLSYRQNILKNKNSSLMNSKTGNSTKFTFIVLIQKNL